MPQHMFVENRCWKLLSVTSWGFTSYHEFAYHSLHEGKTVVH